jgi:predicted permease
MRRTLAKLANLVSPRRSERAEHEMSREIDAHLTLLQDEFERQGMVPEDARRAARRAYGGVEQTKELHREARSLVWIEQFFKDLRYAWSNLLRNPGFTLVAVAALALGIGVNATIFGIYNAVALKQLPVSDPSSVMRVKRFFGENAYAYRYNFAYTEYEYLREHTSVFSGLTAATSAIPVLAAVAAVPEHLNGYAVSANYFADLGVNARIGRTFFPTEDSSPGANTVVILSYRYWQRKFQGDSNAVGQTIKLNGLPYTIVGVAPQGFTGTDTTPTESGFWAPLSMLDQLQPEFGPASDSTWREQFRDSSHPGFQIMARLKEGISREKAQAETDLLIHQYLAGYRESQPTLSITLQRTSYFSSSGDFWVKAFAAAMLMVVSLVLVVACANVANMLLARGVARRREIGIRLALGASRARVVRQLLTESVLLSLLGGAAGILLSAGASKLLWASLITVIPSFRQFLVELDVSPDAHVLLYGLALSVVTGILFGLAPALQSTRSGLYSATQAEGSPSRLRGLLLGIQVAVSVLLLVISGGLLGGVVSSFAKASDLGFDARNTYVLGGSFGTDRAKVSASMLTLRERLTTLPEVSRVAFGKAPLGGSFPFPMTAGEWNGQAATTWASDASFETLGIPILQGRGFTRQEGDREAQVAVISESTARRVWPGEDPLGRRFTLNMAGTFTDYQVIGVAKDVRFTVITEIDPVLVYLPYGSTSRFFRGGLLFRIHGNRDRALLAVQSAVESVVDPTALPTVDLVSLEDGPVAIQRGFLRVLGAFAGTLTLLSLTLAGVGIYGVMAFLVSQRTREIGIRMALGATSPAVIRNVMLQGVWPVLVGILTGVAGAIALERVPVVQGARQFILSPPTFSDPVFYAELALVFAIVVLASLVPARRALRVDPVVALRYE